MKENTLKVKENSKLLPFLIEAGYSKNKIKSLLKYENIKVNGQIEIKYNKEIQVGDIVTITHQRKVVSPFPILYEDQDFLVVYKKERLLTVSPKREDASLYKMALRYIKEKQSHEQLFVLHRLDKETSGIVVFCKNSNLTKELQENWNFYVKKRIYTAVVEGNLKEKSGTLVFYLQDNAEKPVIITDEKHGKKAITNYLVKKENRQYSLVEIEIKTGRKNQIRASFAHIAHPIVGDKKYYAKENPIHRVILVANYLEFIHPKTKKVYKFQAEIPKSFLKIVK